MARARRRKKKALYEVIGQGRIKSGHGPPEEQPSPEVPTEAEPVVPGAETKTSEAASRWPTRPRLVQLNAGRIELSVPYQLGIALLLGVVLLVLVVFRLGQLSYAGGEKPTTTEANKQRTPAAKPKPPARAKTERQPSPVEVAGPVEAKGSNRIVIQTFQVPSQLQPVKQYFAGFEIETEIRKIGDWYYLVTKDKYDNPEKMGTDGYRAKQRIIELGANYRAPQGYESFGPKPFDDAYGMKFDD
ncbi:MAG: hypothetical protein ACYS4W_08500 [Planctomycetota bacterium]|jgi:hypothetical protein